MNDTGTTTIWIAGDQLTPRNSALAGVDRTSACVLMIESLARSRQQPYHKRKLVLIFAAMRGFADDLRREGWRVDYHAEREDFETPLAEHVAAHRPTRFRMMAQSEYGATESMTAAVAKHGLPVECLPHANFVSTDDDFGALLGRGRARVTMETFYRRMRRKTGLLMDGDAPAGGAWNYDAANRLPPKRGMRFPVDPAVPLRPHTVAAIALVAN